MNELENPFYNVYYFKRVFHLNVTLENPLQMFRGFKNLCKTLLKIKRVFYFKSTHRKPLFITSFI